MRTITTTVKVYPAKHLKRYYPEGYARALDQYREHVAQDSFRQDEIVDCLKDLFEAANVKMKNWEIGAYCYSFIKAEFARDGAAELKGKRAFAWVENNLLAQYRAPWRLSPVKASDKQLSHGTFNSIYNTDEKGKPIRRWTKPGARKECPFSGMCYDEDFIDDIFASIKRGDTLKDAFQSLADKAQEMIEAEYDYQRTDEAFLDSAAANEWEYTKEGRMI